MRVTDSGAIHAGKEVLHFGFLQKLENSFVYMSICVFLGPDFASGLHKAAINNSDIHLVLGSETAWEPRVWYSFCCSVWTTTRYMRAARRLYERRQRLTRWFIPKLQRYALASLTSVSGIATNLVFLKTLAGEIRRATILLHAR